MLVRKGDFKRDKKHRKKKRKKEKKKKKRSNARGCAPSFVLGWQASAARFSSPLDLTRKWSPRRPGSPTVGENVGWQWFVEGERIDAHLQKRVQKNLDHIGSLKASELVAAMLERDRANRKIWITSFS